jgi:Fur family peroxide stress response transcriptional regulator
MNNIEILKNYNLKVTPQRLEIVDIISTKGHINIDDLYSLLQNKFPSLSLATIYKNINTMCDRLFLSEVKIPNKKNVYELTKKEHAHTICIKCNNIIDIQLDVSSILEKAQELSKYNLIKSSIIFNGICPKCNKVK